MLTMNEDDETVLSAIRAGASGYLLKGSGADEVQTAIRAAAAGGMVFGATLAAQVASYFAGATPQRREEPFPDLTDRERDVLRLLAAGKSNDAIAARAVRLQQDRAQRGLRRSTPSCTPPAGPRRSSRRGRRGTAGTERAVTMGA